MRVDTWHQNQKDNRINIYSKITNELSPLSDSQLSTLLESSTPIGNSIGGASALLRICDTKIFIKKIRLTDIERLPENMMSTENLFHLPLYYQYGVGSTGFGAWRELAAHIITTNWVITDENIGFPLLYHWRILPSSSQEPNNEQLMQLDKDVKYWNNSSAICGRLEANLHASADIVLFLEYFPYNLYQWFGHQFAQGDSAIEAACKMIQDQLTQTVSFMNHHGFLHFDAHFHNILTDGHQLYFSDFGLAISPKFSLSEEEIIFSKHHIDYDRYSSVTNFLHCLITHYFGKGNNWVIGLQEYITEDKKALSSSASSIIKRYAPMALLMDKFYRGLQENKKTPYPARELEEAWSIADSWN